MKRSDGSRDSGTSGLLCEIDGKPVILHAEDLTTAGFFVETTTPYAMDREVDIVLRSSVGELFARGQVVQVVGRDRAKQERRRPGFGLLFTSLEDDQRAFIGLTLDAFTRAQRSQRDNAARAPQASLPPQRATTSARPPSVRPPKAASTTRPKTPPPAPAVAPSAAPAPSNNSAELKQIAAELRAELTKIQGKTAWTALGLEADAPLDSAKEAFLRMSKRFHPHKFARYDSPELSNLATEVFIAYKRSYSVLTKLAPRTSPTNLQEQTRAANRSLTSIAPAASASIQPAAPRPASNRTRSR
jgi:hypothetical protein